MTVRIVVGVDGSAQSRVALELGIEQARLRDGVVEVVHTWTPKMYGAAPDAGYVAYVDEDGEAESRELMDGAMADVPDDVSVEPIVIKGPVAASLIRHARGADLLVVGSRGRGGFKGLLMGSTSHQVTSYASCPVLVVPSGYRADDESAGHEWSH